MTIGGEEYSSKAINLSKSKDIVMKMKNTGENSSSETRRYPDRRLKRKIGYYTEDDPNLDLDETKKPENKIKRRKINYTDDDQTKKQKDKKLQKDSKRNIRMIKATENNHKKYIDLLTKKGLTKQEAEL